jgi:hypothetical protein
MSASNLTANRRFRPQAVISVDGDSRKLSIELILWRIILTQCNRKLPRYMNGGEKSVSEFGLVDILSTNNVKQFRLAR